MQVGTAGVLQCLLHSRKFAAEAEITKTALSAARLHFWETAEAFEEGPAKGALAGRATPAQAQGSRAQCVDVTPAVPVLPTSSAQHHQCPF